MKAEGKGSKSPLTDSFLQLPEQQVRAARAARRHRRPGRGLVHGPVLRAVLPHHHAQARLPHRLHPDRRCRCCIGTPFFIFFGWLSDRIGRLKIILAGCLIAALTYFPLFAGADALRQPGARGATRQDADHGGGRPDCNFHIFVGPWSKFTDCDRAKDFLTKPGLSFESVPAVAGHERGDQDRRRSSSTGWDEAKYQAGARRRPAIPAAADRTQHQLADGRC